MADLTLDLRYAWRGLAASPSFAFIAIATLAAGIGVTTAVYSLLYAMMFRPMNIPNIDRVVNINGGRSGPSMPLSWPDYQDLKSSQTVFEKTASWTRHRAPLTGDGQPQIVFGEAVEGTFFDLLGVQAAVGRLLSPADDRADAPPAAVLGDNFWRARYGANPQIVGKVIKLHGQPFEVVGVAAPSFRGVDMPNVMPTTLWISLSHAAIFEDANGRRVDRTDRSRPWVRVKARLAEGQTVEAARAQVERIAGQLDTAYPGRPRSSAPGRPSRERASWRVVPAASVHMHESIDTIGVPISYGVMAALALVLLIACVNIANLLLARAASRRVEMATRIAIGASRGRLLRQLLTESALLCAIGGGLGLLLAWTLTRVMALEFNIGRGFAFDIQPVIEWRVLVVSLAATALAGMAFGLAPAVQGARTDVRAAMAGAMTARRRRVSARRMLVIAQLALSVAFLAVGSVFLKGFAGYATHDPGFDLSHTAVAGFELDHRWKDDHDAARRFLGRMRDRAREEPGTSAAAVVSALPIGNPGPSYAAISRESEVLQSGGGRRASASLLLADPDGLRVLGIPLKRGRFFDDRDQAGAPVVAVVSEMTARRIFGDADPVGQRMRFLTQPRSGEAPPQPMVATIVGVTADTDVGSIGRRETGLFFLPFEQFRQHDGRAVQVAVRTDGDPKAAASALSVLARQIDDEVISYVDTGPNVLATDVVPTRIGAALTGSLGAFAFLLAIVGLYGVMSHLVAIRTREIGIRMALGAEAARVVRLILKEGAGVVIAGAGLGVLLAYWIVMFLRRLIFGLEGQEPLVLLIVTASLALVALVACWIPARRAAHIDPNVALRHLLTSRALNLKGCATTPLTTVRYRDIVVSPWPGTSPPTCVSQRASTTN